MVEEAAPGGQTLAMVPALAELLDARGERQLDVAAGVRVPKARGVLALFGSRLA